MSDSFMYELDDIVWEEYGQGDDHIVPHPSEESSFEHGFKGDKFKKSRHEVTNNQGKVQADTQTANKRMNLMSEKNDWSQIPNNVFSDSQDTAARQDSGTLESDNEKMICDYLKNSDTNFINAESCADDVSNSSGLFNNSEKESSDLVYYGWPNYEDAAGMFRNCDSSFGLNSSNQDDLGWFSSSAANDESDNPRKSDFKHPCDDASTLKNVSEGSTVLTHQVSECKDEFVTDKKIPNSIGLDFKNNKPRPCSSDYIQADAPYPHSDQTMMDLALSGFTSENNSVPSGNNVEYLCSPNTKESSSINCRPEEISYEATSFFQLQRVTEQLDLKTKLCIRDSLYRLARSAEQRHNFANLNGSTYSNSPFIVTGSTKFTGFMDIETDTNPIDRSIAHLLFHRPSDASAVPPHMTIHGSMTMCQEESAVVTDGNDRDEISKLRSAVVGWCGLFEGANDNVPYSTYLATKEISYDKKGFTL